MQSPVRVADNEASDGSRTNPHISVPSAADTAHTTKLNDVPLPSVRFLTMSPDNELAQLVTACGAKIITNSDEYKHHRQFFERVETEANTHVLGEAQAQVGGSAASQARKRESSHRFVLDLSVEPTGPHHSWVIGRGSDKAADRGVDILITAPREMLSSPVVALIWIHRHSGAFMLKAVSKTCPVQYLSGLGSGRDLTLGVNDQTVLWMRRNRIRFGVKRLDFVLDVAVDEGEEHFPIFRNRFLRRDGDDKARVPSDHLDALPKQTHNRVHDFIIHSQILGTGAFGRVSGGVQASTGLPVAVKVARSARKADILALKNEIRIAGLLSPHDNIMPFLKTWCSHADSPPCFACPRDDYYMVMPLAESNFEALFSPSSSSSPDMRMRRKLLRDITKGLAHIHSRGIMHRDISPRNLLVMLDEQDNFRWRAVICDFGKAIKAFCDDATALGPVHTVAPEVWTLSEPGHYAHYTSAIDMWSLGYTHLYILQRPALYRTDRQRHRMLLLQLDALCAKGDIDETEKSYVQGLLAIEPDQRPTAEEALGHHIWESI